MTLIREDRHCQGYDTEPGVHYHAHDLPRCRLTGVAKVKGRWLCDGHAVLALAASTDLVQIEASRCPSCGASTSREVMREQPLLRHGGYGAARRRVTEHCDSPTCHWFLTTDVSEERPA